MKRHIPFAEADHLADELIERLRPRCQRIEKAGSLRRRKAEIGDIDFVIIPKFLLEMFGGESTDHELNAIDWGTWGHVIANGPKYKKILLPQGVNLELSIVTPPAQWGVLLMIRTGPEEFSHKMVKPRVYNGLMPSLYRFQDGAIWCRNHIIETPEEDDLFGLFGMEFVAPEARQ